MTFHPPSERRRDQQDHIERHIFGEIEYVEGNGSVVRVTGTGTEDQEAMVIATGFGFNLPKNSNAEVILMSGSADSGLKFALLTLPIDKQRQWKEGRGGIQNPMDPDHAIEFKDGQVHLTKGSFSIGNGGTIDVREGKVYIRGDLVVTGTVTANAQVVTPNVIPGSDPNVPPFDPA